MMPEEKYNVQCFIHGYCGTVGKENPKLYAECVAREKAGYIDAIMLGPNNDFCSECQEARRREELSAALCSWRDEY